MFHVITSSNLAVILLYFTYYSVIILYSTNYRLLSSHDVMVLIFICFVLKHLTNNDLILFETVRVNEFLLAVCDN